MLDLKDRLEIQDLYARYSWAVDSSDADAWADTFAPDGIFIPGRVVSGRAAIRHYAVQRIEERRAGSVRNTQHWITNLWVDGAGAEARGRCYLMTIGIPVDRDQPTILGIRWYKDSLRKINGAWLFQRREVPTEMPGSLTELWEVPEDDR